MGTNSKKKRRNRSQAIFLILFIPAVTYGIYYYYQQKDLAQFQKAYFENSDGSKTPTFYLDLADTKQKRSQGLMYVKEMPKNRGMLFKFETEKNHSFWMKNTYIPLDMIFVDSKFKVVGILESVPILNEKKRRIAKPSIYVVELNAGQARENKIVTGSVLYLEKKTS